MINENTAKDEVLIHSQPLGFRLFRNNSGVAFDKNGRAIRYGLGNDSKRINEVFKSPDLVGYYITEVTPDMVGKKIAVFVGFETKKPGWQFRHTPHEIAQRNFLNPIIKSGGIAGFTTGIYSATKILKDWFAR